MTCVLWNLVSVRLATVLVSLQDRCTVCAKRPIGFVIVLDAPDELLANMGHVESSFGPFGDGVSFDVRYMHGLR